jgi:hypothetical protein
MIYDISKMTNSQLSGEIQQAAKFIAAAMAELEAREQIS